MYKGKISSEAIFASRTFQGTSEIAFPGVTLHDFTTEIVNVNNSNRYVSCAVIKVNVLHDVRLYAM